MKILIISILILAFLIRVHKLNGLMMFIGDFAWFYISARDMIMTGNVPLVGITSSQTWLHQGPLWTYLLAFPMLISNFNPLSGAYLSVILGVITVFLVYKLASEMFSKKIGIITGLLYACSPLIIIHSRMPYHTSVIPLFTAIFLLFLYRWIKGDIKYFPWIMFSLALLYNFELSTVVMWFIVLIITLYGILSKKRWVRNLFSRKLLLISALAFVIPMTPILIHDTQHEYLQTIKFVNWLIYHRVIKYFLELSFLNSSLNAFFTMISFLIEQSTRLIFLPSRSISVLIFLLSFTWLVIIILKMFKKKSFEASYIVLFLTIIFPLFAFIFGQTPSEAYMPIFFPTVIILIALFLNKLSGFKPLFVPTILTITFICFLNVYTLISSDYLMKKIDGYGPTFKDRLEASKEIIGIVNNGEYNLIGVGEGSEHKSFTMNYEYLTWWFGNGPSKSEEELKVLIKEDRGKIYVTQLN